jgi:cell wall-associated NlpC family hydrolase
MTPDDVFEYLNLPHKPGGIGPLEYDCWNLLRHLQKKYFGVTLPDAPIGDEAACLALFKDKAESGEWQAVAKPEHGDCALLRGGTWPHVGIYLDFDGGGVLHAMEGSGVIWTRLPKLRSFGFGRTVYYRVKHV